MAMAMAMMTFSFSHSFCITFQWFRILTVDEPHGNGSMDSHYQRVQDDLYLI
jgi:hypothetical protein